MDRLLYTGIAFLVFAAMLIAFMILSEKSAKKNKTVKVSGKCIGIDKKHNSTGSQVTTYAGIFQYEYNGKTYESRGSHCGTSPYVGEVRDLLIDPQDPEKFYDILQGKKNRKALIKATAVIIVVAMILIGAFLVLNK